MGYTLSQSDGTVIASPGYTDHETEYFICSDGSNIAPSLSMVEVSAGGELSRLLPAESVRPEHALWKYLPDEFATVREELNR